MEELTVVNGNLASKMAGTLAKTDPLPPASTSRLRQRGLIADQLVRLQRSVEKRRQVLKFLRDEIWTSAEVVATLLGIGYPAAHALLKAMQRDGLTSSTSVMVPATGNRVGVVRRVLHGITAQGLAFAWDMDEMPESRRPWDPTKTNGLFVPHQIQTQMARLLAEAAGWTTWTPTRLLMGLGLPKLPDAEAHDPDGVSVAIEIEREIKTDRRYEAVIGAYVTQMKKDGRWTRVDYVCPSRDFAARLARVFGRLGQLRLEVPGGAGVTGKLQQTHLDRFRFYSNGEWPSGPWVVAKLGEMPRLCDDSVATV